MKQPAKDVLREQLVVAADEVIRLRAEVLHLRGQMNQATEQLRAGHELKEDAMADSPYLSRDDIKALCRTPRRKGQAEFLRNNGIRHYLDAHGWPVVLRSAIEGKPDPPGPLDAIRPTHVFNYLQWRRDAPVSANREKSLLSHLWNWCRKKGYTDLPNPCAGVNRNREDGRDVYVEDDVLQRVYDAADQVLKDAMDLAYLTGQRPADVRELDRRNIRDGVLVLRQGKTKMQMRIAITGELKVLIYRLLSRKCPDDAPISTRLLLGEDWLPIGKDALRYRFDRARERAGIPKDQFQFRDLRAKAGTDKADSAGDIRQAQQQLGHQSVTTTEIYVRKRRGALTSPTK